MLKIITGKLCSGKSTRLLNYLEEKGPSNFFGYVSYCNAERTKYWIKNIETEESKLLFWESDSPKYSRFDYDNNLFSLINDQLIKRTKRELAKGSGLIGVLDEVGNIEANKDGLYSGFRALVDYAKVAEAIIVVRENFIDSLELKDYQLID